MNETIPNNFNELQPISNGSYSDHPNLLGPASGDTNFVEWATICDTAGENCQFGDPASFQGQQLQCGEMARASWEHPGRPGTGSYAIYPNASSKPDLVFMAEQAGNYTVILRGAKTGSKMLSLRVDGDTYVDLDSHFDSFEPVEGLLIANQECSSGPSSDWYTNQQIKGKAQEVVEVPAVGYLRSFGEPRYFSRETGQVPEPDMVGLLFIGLVAFIVARRWKK